MVRNARDGWYQPVSVLQHRKDDAECSRFGFVRIMTDQPGEYPGDAEDHKQRGFDGRGRAVKNDRLPDRRRQRIRESIVKFLARLAGFGVHAITRECGRRYRTDSSMLQCICVIILRRSGAGFYIRPVDEHGSNRKNKKGSRSCLCLPVPNRFTLPCLRRPCPSALALARPQPAFQPSGYNAV